MSGCSAAWIAHLLGVQGVGGSNPPIPTIFSWGALNDPAPQTPVASARVNRAFAGLRAATPGRRFRAVLAKLESWRRKCSVAEGSGVAIPSRGDAGPALLRRACEDRVVATQVSVAEGGVALPSRGDAGPALSRRACEDRVVATQVLVAEGGVALPSRGDAGPALSRRASEDRVVATQVFGR
jgi:hypothetical protein